MTVTPFRRAAKTQRPEATAFNRHAFEVLQKLYAGLQRADLARDYNVAFGEQVIGFTISLGHDNPARTWMAVERDAAGLVFMYRGLSLRADDFTQLYDRALSAISAYERRAIAPGPQLSVPVR